MLVYSATKKSFMADIESDRIADIIEEQVRTVLHHKTAASERRSWEQSLPFMHRVLNDRKIPDDVGVAIEYNIPPTSKRVDFIISGYNKTQPEVIIVELKQWESITAVEGSNVLVNTFLNKAIRTTNHPSYQAWSYAALIEDFNESVQVHQITLNPCTYLHNYQRNNDDPIDSSQYKPYIDDAPVFTRGQSMDLRAFIMERIKKGDDRKILFDIENGKIKPAKRLQEAIQSMLKGTKEFTLIDEQMAVFDTAMQQARLCSKDNKKRTIIVEGGPGTGKSVVAINLLCQMILEDIISAYVTKTSAPRDVYRLTMEKGSKSKFDSLFFGSGCLTKVEPNAYPALIVDEAHRLILKNRYDKESENQIMEIIRASKFNIFFIDESQEVHWSDIGKVSEIEHWAEQLGSEITRMELESQFRCNGSDGYLSWLDNVLDIRQTANETLDGINYDFKVVDTPEQLRKMITEKNDSGEIARLVAGYCWNWDSKGKNNTDVHDIKIGDFEMSWNLGNGIFSADESSINEIGCIHTCQGLEYQYVGVIIGPDLTYDGKCIRTSPDSRAKTDKSLHGYKKALKENPAYAQERVDRIIKNTYRTLMTRGMKGCYVYCTDPALRDYLRSQIQ